MATAVGGARTDQLLQHLQMLIRLSIEGVETYRRATPRLGDRELRIVLDQISVQRTAHIEQIQNTLAINGIKPALESSFLAKIRRFLEMFHTSNDDSMLHRAIDTESRIQKAYETVIVLDPLGPLAETLKEQRAFVATMVARLEELDLKRHP